MTQSAAVGPVVVPLDGSTFSEVAIPMARLLAERTGAELHLVHVMTPPAPGPFHPEEQLSFEEHVRSRSQGYLDRHSAALEEGSGRRARTALLPGEDGVAKAIEEYAREQAAGWIVLTTHGAGGLSRWILGSAADALARTAATPLLFLRPWDTTGMLDEGERAVYRILVPLDGSEAAEAALAPATSLAHAFGGALDLVRVVLPRPRSAQLHQVRIGAGSKAIDEEAEAYLARQTEPLRASGLVVEAWRMAHQDPAEGILTVSAERGTDVVVMSTHGRRGLARAVIGSVADRVLKKGAVTLALVRPDPGAPGQG